jgi:hypothetical protein
MISQIVKIAMAKVKASDSRRAKHEERGVLKRYAAAIHPVR